MEWLFILAGIAIVAIYLARRRDNRHQTIDSEPLAFDIPIQVEFTTSSIISETEYTRPRERDPTNPDLPLYDPWETDHLRGIEGEIHVKVEAQISYVDRDGQPSSRMMTTRTLAPWEGGHAILAWCRGRQAHRTFVVDRIREFVNLSTGEIVGDVVAHLREAYAASPAGQVASAFSRHEAEVDIMLFVARANGHLSPKERHLILTYLQVNNSDIDAPTSVWANALPPDSPSVNKLKSSLRAASALDAARREMLAATIEAMAPKRTNELTRVAAATVLKALEPPPTAG